MKPIVLDASVMLARVLPDEQSVDAETLLHDAASAGALLLVPPHWRLECWHGIHRATRRGRLTADDAEAALQRIEQAPIARLPDHAPREVLFHLARTYRLSIYDAAYLACALEEGALLATGDSALAKAAEACGCRWRPSRKKRARARKKS